MMLMKTITSHPALFQDYNNIMNMSRRHSVVGHIRQCTLSYRRRISKTTSIFNTIILNSILVISLKTSTCTSSSFHTINTSTSTHHHLVTCNVNDATTITRPVCWTIRNKSAFISSSSSSSLLSDYQITNHPTFRTKKTSFQHGAKSLFHISNNNSNNGNQKKSLLYSTNTNNYDDSNNVHSTILSSNTLQSSSSSSSSSNIQNKEKEHNNIKNMKKTSIKHNQKPKKELFRADKVLSTRTNYSRSQSFTILQSRRVSMIILDEITNHDHDNLTNDTKQQQERQRISILKGPKEKIPMDAILYLDGTKLIPPPPPLLLIYHKPKFVLSAMEEKHFTTKDHLGNHLPDRYKKMGMHPVGRLDYDTSGLLLFSSEGDLTQRLLHPKYSIEKEYVATVSGGSVNIPMIKKQFETVGVETSEGIHFGRVVKCEELSMEESKAIIMSHQQQQQQQQKIEDTSTPTSDETTISLTKPLFAVENSILPLTNITLVVQEGKYRMVRRMLFNAGHPVIELKRERHGNIVLGDLKVGHFRDCTEDEAEWAKSIFH